MNMKQMKADPNLEAAVAAGDEFIVDYVRVWDEEP